MVASSVRPSEWRSSAVKADGSRSWASYGVAESTNGIWSRNLGYCQSWTLRQAWRSWANLVRVRERETISDGPPFLGCTRRRSHSLGSRVNHRTIRYTFYNVPIHFNAQRCIHKGDGAFGMRWAFAIVSKEILELLLLSSWSFIKQGLFSIVVKEMLHRFLTFVPFSFQTVDTFPLTVSVLSG